jgi:hypothetical protein
MRKFGRFEFGKSEPVETYEGDYMALETGYVRIFEGDETFVSSLTKPRLIAAIHLDKGQSVREIKAGAKKATDLGVLTQATGRKFR